MRFHTQIMTIALAFGTLLLTASHAAAADVPDEGAILKTLRTGHPRLIILDADIERVRKLIAADADARKLRDDLREAAEKIIPAPTVVHELIGPRLLGQSRECLNRVYTLAGLYRLERDRRFADRAIKEMLAAAAFADWNPSHFLDTAEMSHALAVGYDWLYDVLTPEQRAAIRQAIVEKGLKPGMKVYASGGWWAKSKFNWNQVCNGGMTIGALAVADEEPALAASIVAHAAKSIRLPMEALAPDGGWPEGPGYWNYAMAYTAYYLAAVQTALGTDFGLLASPGLADTGLFRIYSIGPTNQTFNFADAGAGAGNTPQMFYFARVFDRPVYAYFQRQHRSGAAMLDLLWYDTRGTETDLAALPFDRPFQNVDVVFMRTGWTDPNAMFLGFKGGDNAANHSNLDLGTFVIDALGQRWAIELGADDYNLPGYFGDKRWTYYRLRTEGQNTLVINGENQNPKARAKIVHMSRRPDRCSATADLTAAYAPAASRVQRTFTLFDRDSHILLEDQIEAAQPLDIQWNMHTAAAIHLDGATARLVLGHDEFRATLHEPADAAWRVEEVNPPPPQKPLKDIRKLVLAFKSKPPRTRIIVDFQPIVMTTEAK